MNRIIARVWRSLRGPVQWRLLWLGHAKFIVGVTGIVRDHDGQVLLLRHRLWPEGRQWGLPTGYARASETFTETVAREVREETGLAVTVGEPVSLRSGYRLRVEVAYNVTAPQLSRACSDPRPSLGPTRSMSLSPTSRLTWGGGP